MGNLIGLIIGVFVVLQVHSCSSHLDKIDKGEISDAWYKWGDEAKDRAYKYYNRGDASYACFLLDLAKGYYDKSNYTGAHQAWMNVSKGQTVMNCWRYSR